MRERWPRAGHLPGAPRPRDERAAMPNHEGFYAPNGMHGRWTAVPLAGPSWPRPMYHAGNAEPDSRRAPPLRPLRSGRAHPRHRRPVRGPERTTTYPGKRPMERIGTLDRDPVRMEGPLERRRPRRPPHDRAPVRRRSVPHTDRRSRPDATCRPRGATPTMLTRAARGPARRRPGGSNPNSGPLQVGQRPRPRARAGGPGSRRSSSRSGPGSRVRRPGHALRLGRERTYRHLLPPPGCTGHRGVSRRAASGLLRRPRNGGTTTRARSSASRGRYSSSYRSSCPGITSITVRTSPPGSPGTRPTCTTRTGRPSASSS